MKSFVVLCALVAVCAGAAVREKRGWSSGWDGGLVSGSSGWSGGLVSGSSGWSSGWNGGWSGADGGWGGHYAPSQKVIAVNKVVNVQREVSVPKLVHVRKIISEPRVVTVKKVVPTTTHYEHAPVYSPGWAAGWW